jgi:hypothetical protein
VKISASIFKGINVFLIACLYFMTDLGESWCGRSLCNAVEKFSHCHNERHCT